MLLDATTPADFFAIHLRAHQERHDETPADDEPRTWCTLDDLLEGDARWLRAAHARIVSEGDPAHAASKCLIGWVGGSLGEIVGFVYATTGAGILANGRVRWRFHPDGWPDRVDISQTRAVVPWDHPWSGLPRVDVVADHEEVRRRAIAALASTLDPVVEAVRGLAKVGRNALWAEVADGVGGATAGMPELAGSVATISSLQELLATPGVPWRSRPTLWAATGESGDMVVSRKGGCCLVYTSQVDEHDAGEGDGELDAELCAYRERFPHVKGEPDYCSTCCFREPEDVEQRQVFWVDLQSAKATAAQTNETR